MDFDLLVIGASAAGWQGAIAAARLDRNVGLIALRSVSTHSAPVDLRAVPGELLRDVCADWPISRRQRRADAPHTESESWRQFADYTLRIWRQEQDAYRDQFLAAGGQVWSGDAQLTGPHEILLKRPRVKPVTLRSEHLLIATGTIPRNPTFASNFIPPARAAAWILDAPNVAGDSCVVGASLTGLRAACLLALWGGRVRLVDGRRLASHVSSEDTTDWYAWGNDLGVKYDSGEDVIGLKSKSPRKLEVILESGRNIATETVWLATGREGRTGELRLANAGVSTDDCGRLWCDPSHRTWVHSIYAVGDVVGFPPGTGCELETVGEIAKNIFRPSRTSVSVS